MSQSELARRVGIDRTTLNKIERETRGDVSISQLFTFADVLETAPVYLLTPRLEDHRIQLTKDGRELTARDARAWIRGEMPKGSSTQQLNWFLALPRDEQLALIEEAETAGLSPLTAALMSEETTARVKARAETIDRLVASLQKSGAAPRKLRSRKEHDG